MLHQALAAGKMGIGERLTVTDDHIRSVREDWGDQFGDLTARVLIIRVSVDNDIRPKRQRELDAADKSPRKPSVAAVAQDVIRAVFERHLGSAIV